MKIERFDSTQERKVLTGMITEDSVVARISPKWDSEGLFSSRYANQIGTWCVNYHKKYSKAPGKSVEGLFASWAEGKDDKDTTKLIGTFLASLSDEYESTERLAPEYLIDVAGKLFNRVRISKLADGVQGDVDSNRLDEAEKRIAAYSRVEMGVGGRISLFTDDAEVDEVFTDQEESLVDYDGALDHFFRGELTRDAFVAFMGPEKSGKSFYLIDVAFRALCQRRRVAFFEVGDMSRKQIKRRFITRASKHPMRSTNPDRSWPCVVKYPLAIRRPEGKPPAEVDFEDRTFDRPLDITKAKKRCNDLMKNKVKSKKPYFYLSVHPNSSINVEGIKSTLQSWALEDGWVPDIIVVDYSDILAAPSHASKTDPRDRTNETWKQLRALSQEMHCLVVTATQADAASYEKATMDRSNFSEDHRKLAHCTGLVGINVTSPEKELGITRLNWIVLREGEFSSRRCVHVAGCLPLANPTVVATF